jgi:hypothetical protein
METRSANDNPGCSISATATVAIPNVAVRTGTNPLLAMSHASKTGEIVPPTCSAVPTSTARAVE